MSARLVATKEVVGTWRRWLMNYPPVFLWICVIFFLASSSGSSAETSKIIGSLIKFFFPSADEAFIAIVHAIVRKTAHLTEYAILASLAARAFLTSSSAWLRKYWALWAILLVAVAASLDEFNQSFNVQRTGSPMDTLLDISGGLLALTLIWMIRKRKRPTN